MNGADAGRAFAVLLLILLALACCKQTPPATSSPRRIAAPIPAPHHSGIAHLRPPAPPAPSASGASAALDQLKSQIQDLRDAFTRRDTNGN